MTNDEALLQVAPELSTVAPDRRAYFLDQMALQVAPSLGQYALALATAHELTLSNRGGAVAAAGPLISEKEGELSRSYADLSAHKNLYFSSTTYGERFMQLVSRNTLGARNRMVAA